MCRCGGSGCPARARGPRRGGSSRRTAAGTGIAGETIASSILAGAGTSTSRYRSDSGSMAELDPVSVACVREGVDVLTANEAFVCALGARATRSNAVGSSSGSGLANGGGVVGTCGRAGLAGVDLGGSTAPNVAAGVSAWRGADGPSPAGSPRRPAASVEASALTAGGAMVGGTVCSGSWARPIVGSARGRCAAPGSRGSSGTCGARAGLAAGGGGGVAAGSRRRVGSRALAGCSSDATRSAPNSRRGGRRAGPGRAVAAPAMPAR
jgi:hypothetical protein